MKIRFLLFGVASLFITAALSGQDVKVLEGGRKMEASLKPPLMLRFQAV